MRLLLASGSDGGSRSAIVEVVSVGREDERRTVSSVWLGLALANTVVGGETSHMF